MKLNRKKVAVALLASFALALGVWIVFNPFDRFGWCRFALTTYNAIPRPIMDIQVRSDGAVRRVAKTHDLALDQVRWLLEPKPQLLIIANGWDAVLTVRPEIEAIRECQVKVLNTRDAIRLFNQLKKSGQRIAIHLHSTC